MADEETEKVIPASVVMLSGCMDSQTSADVFDVSSFDMPQGAGPGGAGGACTNALLSTVYDQEDTNPLLKELMASMHRILKEKSFTQKPQLSASKKLSMQADRWAPVLPGGSGRTRALLIGINYIGTNGELKGCHNDVEAMKTYLLSQGFSDDDSDMMVLMDDGEHQEPTRSNILEAFDWLVAGAQAGDSLFFHYSGHGGNVPDQNGDEKDGRDETLIPVDYQEAGQIRDDNIYKNVVVPLPRGCQLTAVMDCCHSGTVFDLPYKFVADDSKMEDIDNIEMEPNEGFSIGLVLTVAATVLAKLAEGHQLTDIMMDMMGGGGDADGDAGRSAPEGFDGISDAIDAITGGGDGVGESKGEPALCGCCTIS